MSVSVSWETPWQEENGWEALARFASVDSLPAEFRFEPATPGQLFEQLSARRWAYVTDPWYPGQGQLVRDPDTVRVNGAGTCLDVALMYSAMALYAGMKPFLCILENDSERHALVLLPHGALSNEVLRTWDADSFEDFAGLFDCVEVVAALQGQGWAHALEAGRGRFRGRRFDRCRVINVGLAQESGFEPLTPLPIDSLRRPTIYQMLPPLPTIELEQWQQDISTEPDPDSGRYVVVAGESGMGKTAAVLGAAHRAARGAGWLLPAQDANALLTSFGTAAARGRPQLAESVKGAAALAMQRLRESVSSWVVVIDGADHPDGPEHYRHLLPVPKPGQVVFVTTTQVGRWQGWNGVDEVHIPTDAPSPLLEGLGAGPGENVAACVKRRLAGVTDDQFAFARTLAWVPAIPDAVPAGMTSEHARRSYSVLMDAGMVNRSSGLMHNLVAKAIRDAHAPDATLFTSFVEAYPAQFSAADSSGLEDLIGALSAPGRDDVVFALANARTRDHSAWAAQLYQQLLTDMGCLDSGGHIMRDWLPVDADQAIRARKCLEGVARQQFRDRAGYERAKETVDKGLQLAAVAPDFVQDSKLRALELNARRTSISRNRLLNDSEKYAALEKVLAELDDLYRERKEDPRCEQADVYRARFNLAGPKLRLGQLAAQLPGASATPSEWFDRAFKDYLVTYEWRRHFFGTDDIEDVATCLNGQGTIKYFQAISATAADLGTRARLLGEAAELCSRALQARLIVAWSDGGSSAEVLGTSKILAKIAGAQMELHRGKKDPWELSTEALTETVKDWNLFTEQQGGDRG